MTWSFKRIIYTLFIIISIPLLMFLVSFFLYRLESFVFEVMGYEWNGPRDLFFGFSALLEVLLGYWVAFFFLPRKLNISISNYLDIETKRYFWNVLLIGLSMGIGFFGTLKVILILGLLFLR